jgi:hypothetical protein
LQANKEARKNSQLSQDLLRKLPQIRAGDDREALIHLYKIGYSREYQFSFQAIANEYNAELAEAAKEGFRCFWIKQTPPPMHEIRRMYTPSLCAAGILGIEIEILQGLDIRTIDDHRLQRIITYAAWKPDKLPAWLNSCAERSPGMLREVFESSLRRDYEIAPDGITLLLWKFPRASRPVRAACAPVFISLLQTGDPPSNDVLRQVLLSIRDLPTHAEALRLLCRPRCKASFGDPERFSLWWRVWLTLDARDAIEFLANEVSSVLAQDMADECILACFAQRLGEEDHLLPVRGHVTEMNDLLSVVLRHISPDKDVDSLQEPRCNAQRFRDSLIGAVTQTGAPEAVQLLDRLAAEPWGDDLWRDWLRYCADECAAHGTASMIPLESALELIDRSARHTAGVVTAEVSMTAIGAPIAPTGPSTRAEVASSITFPQPLLEAYKNGKLAVLVGSGLSLASGVQGAFPKWTELPDRLLDQVEHHGALERAQIDLKRNYFKTSGYLPLEGMLSELDSIKTALRTSRKYQAALSHIFRPKNAAPGDVHRALIDLGVPLLLTTNYDELIERAEESGARTMYTWKDAPKVLGDLKDQRKVLFKIHGSAHQEDTVIMTQAEYDNAHKSDSYKQTMSLLLQHHTFLMVGYGINDPLDLDLVLKLNASVFGSAAETHYALIKDPNPNDRDRWSREFNVRVVPYKEHAELPAILRALRDKAMNADGE